MKSGLRSGKLIKWKDDRGFGFIQPADGSREVFIHISGFKNVTRRPQENDTIYYYTVTDSDRKVRACDAFISGARSKPGFFSQSSIANRSNFPIFKTVLLSILPLVGSVHFTWVTHNPLPLILYPVMSLVTYVLYADDKSRAQRRDWRTSENKLHLCEFAGGWLGGFVAQKRLHHKSQKKPYQTVFWAIVAIHYLIWLLWLILGQTFIMRAALEITKLLRSL
jgi:uncharacterized membrane protein YsdA (DUF1294 family)/cold shock CspA family protein